MVRLSRLHVRPVALAQRKSHAELWVELCKLVQTGKFLLSADAGAHRGQCRPDAEGAALNDASACPPSEGARLLYFRGPRDQTLKEKQTEGRTSGRNPINVLCLAVAFLAVCGLIWIALTQ